MLYLIYFSDGEHKTAHYAICTAFMALGMMLPGMAAGWLQELIGYKHFFYWVMTVSYTHLGNSPCTISVPFIQLGFRRRARRYTERNTPTVRHTRSRLGTWRRTLPDRSRRHGRTRLSLSRNTATLFRRCEHRKTILKYTP